MFMDLFDKENKEAFKNFKSNIDSTTNKDNKEATDRLLTEIHTYIWMQLNPEARLGNLNQDQVNQALSQCNDGLFTLIYVANYTDGMDIIDKDHIFYGARNYARMLFSRVLNGADREILIADINAKQKTIVMGNQ